MRSRLVLIAITLLAFLVRITRLDAQPLWWDEGYSFFFATRDFITMLERTAVDIHPPLYYALLQGWFTLIGKSDITARLLSVTIGVAAIPLIYALARELFDDDLVATIAAFLLALAPLHVYYSQEVRMYGLVTLLGLGSMYLFVRLLHMVPGKPRTAVVALAYILTTTAALYTQYYAAFILASQVLIALALLARQSSLVSRNAFLHWLVAWFAIAMLYLPWVWFAGAKLYTYVTGKVTHEAYTALTPLTFLMNHLTAFAVGHITQNKWLDIAAALFAALGILGIVDAIRNAHLVELPVELQPAAPDAGNGETLDAALANPSPTPNLKVAQSQIVWTWDTYTLVTITYLVIPTLFGFAINLVFPFHPIRSERLLLLALPAFCLLVALGIRALWERRTWVGAMMLILTALISGTSLYDFYTVPRYAQDDYRPLIMQLQTLAQPSDHFLAIYPWQIGYLEAYYNGAPLNIVETPNDTWIKNPTQMQNDLDALLAKNPRVWVPALQTLGRLVEDALDAYLRPRTCSVVDEWFGTTRLELFARAAAPIRVNDGTAFENTARLRERGISDEPIVAGQDLVRVELLWSDLAASDLRASLRLLDTNGNTWMQEDRDISEGLQQIGVIVGAGTPPGTYDLRLVVYHAREGRTLGTINLGHVQVRTTTQPQLAALPHRIIAEFTNGVRLVGAILPDQPIRPGDTTSLVLFWQATRAIAHDVSVAVQIQDGGGRVYASTQAPPARGIHPATRWQIGELVRDPQTFTLRGDTPDGTYRVMVALDNTSNWIEVGKIAAKNRVRYFGAPSPTQKFSARLGEVAQLVGYDLVQTDSAIRVVLYWHALGTPTTSFTVFVQLIDGNNIVQAQRDHIPGAGAYPTTSWVKGEYLVDVYDIAPPSPGEYKIIVGMYDAKTNTRLPVFDASQNPVGDYSELSTRITVR